MSKELKFVNFSEFNTTSEIYNGECWIASVKIQYYRILMWRKCITLAHKHLKMYLLENQIECKLFLHIDTTTNTKKTS